MQRRLFIAIPILDDVSFELEKIVAPLELGLHRSAKIVPPENWHFTLVFLGDTDDTKIPIIGDVLRSVFPSTLQDTVLNIERIIFGPTERNPRMIWFLGDKKTSIFLDEIVTNLKRELSSKKINFVNTHQHFTAHVTYARFYEGKRPLVKLPKFHQISFPLSELVLMESHLDKSGAHYDILERAVL